MSVTNAPATLIMRASLPLSKPYVGPNNELEALAATTFAEVFNLDKVGIDDEFFELGGDFLFAEVLSVALSKRLGMELQPSLLVEFGSPRQFVSHLNSKSAQPALGKEIASLSPEIEGEFTPLFLDGKEIGVGQRRSFLD